MAVVALVGDTVLVSALGVQPVDTTRDWTEGIVGWLVFLALAGFNSRLYLVLLLVPFGTRAVLFTLEGAGTERFATLGSITIVIVILQGAAGLFFAALRNEASAAQHAHDRRGRLDTGRAVAEQLQRDFRSRTAAMTHTTVPLLRELVNGTSSPQDASTRCRARIEAARLRRLFAEADVTDGTLLAEVRSVVEQVERAQVTAILDCPQTPPALPGPTRRALLDAPMATLALAASTARVVIQRHGSEVVVSVATDGPPPQLPHPVTDPAVRTRMQTMEDMTWTESTWTEAPDSAAP